MRSRRTRTRRTVRRAPADSVTHGIAGQGGSDDATLEIAPQPGLVAPKPAVKEIPTDRNFNPGEDTSSIDPNFRPGTENGTGDSEGNLNSSLNRNFNNQPHARPYLGVTVAYRSMCFRGGEEHGLEVLTVDPNGPAAKAGLHARSGMSGVGAAVRTLSRNSSLRGKPRRQGVVDYERHGAGRRSDNCC